MAHYTLDQMNALSRDAFVAVLGQVVEHSPWVAEKAFEARPFKDLASLHQAMVKAIEQAGPAVWAEILNLHPELSGKEAQEGALTDFSVSEQAGLGLDRLSSIEFKKIGAFNKSYREKFGFPFVVCVRLLSSREQLFSEMERRLNLSVSDELRTGIGQVMEICRLRLEQLLGAAQT